MGRLVLLNNIKSGDVNSVLKLLSATRHVTSVFVAPGGTVNVFDLEALEDGVPQATQIQFKVVPSGLSKVVKALRVAGHEDFDILELKVRLVVLFELNSTIQKRTE